MAVRYVNRACGQLAECLFRLHDPIKGSPAHGHFLVTRLPPPENPFVNPWMLPGETRYFGLLIERKLER